MKEYSPEFRDLLANGPSVDELDLVRRLEVALADQRRRGRRIVAIALATQDWLRFWRFTKLGPPADGASRYRDIPIREVADGEPSRLELDDGERQYI